MNNNIYCLFSNHLFNFDHTIAASLLQKSQYPWEVLGGIEDLIRELGPTLDPQIYEDWGNNVYVAKSARVSPSAHISGPCIVCPNAEIRHCAFVRGSAIIGAGAVVGNSTELKNSILFDGVQVPHYNYVGDSILGYKSHLGAGAITSNVKSDKSHVVIKGKDFAINTGRKKVGAMVGDFVEVGCGSVLCPGTVIGPNTSVYPLVRVRGVIDQDCIIKSETEIVKKR